MPTEHRHSLPRFSIKRLLLATTLIAVGTVPIASELTGGRYTDNEWVGLLLWFVGGALIGAGIFMPFSKTWIGVLFGLAMQGWAYAVAILVQLNSG
jgi:hypothetical protein